MGDLNRNATGFLKRASELLNNKVFSDVQILVKDGNNQKTFPAHKLFLAMGSQEFANMFYNNAESPNFIKIFDYKPQTVYSMLQFLYTDILDFTSVEHAKEIYSLAKKYDVKDLLHECSIFLTKEETTLENLFDKYEFALGEHLPDALSACRNLVSSQTMIVLKSPQFEQASMAVIEDILKLDYLSVMNEMEVIDAAIRWAQRECCRRGSFTENLRICLYPLFKHLRFLALSADEFCDLLERNDNILNSHESSILTMSILQPGSTNRIPPGFSSNSCQRKFPTDAILTTSDRLLKSSNIFDNASLIPDNNLDGSFEKPIDKTEKLDRETKIKQCLRDGGGPLKPLDLDKKFESNLMEFNRPNMEVSKPFVPIESVSNINWGVTPPDRIMNESKYKSTDTLRDLDYINNKGFNSQFAYPNLNIEALSKPRIPAPVYQKPDVFPVYNKKQSPVLKVSPHVPMTQRRTFDFPLCELQRCIASALKRDIKCSATIHLSKGAIEIYGIELKIQQQSNAEEVIVSYLSLYGSSHKSMSESYEEKLRNSVYPIHFPEPIKLTQNNHIKIEVLVEELVLNRCSGYRSPQCELNCGLNVTANITMHSNQYIDESRDYFYLINRLLYKPCS